MALFLSESGMLTLGVFTFERRDRSKIFIALGLPLLNLPSI